MSILVLGGDNDPHVSVVIDKIRNRGGKIYQIYHDNLGAYSLQLCDGGGYDLYCHGQLVEDVSVVWNRPKIIVPLARESDASRAEVLRYREWIGFMRAISFLYSDLTVNNPTSKWANSSKIFQWKLASSVGLRCPKTLITTNKGDALKFCEKHGHLIGKTLNDPRIQDNSNRKNDTIVMTTSIERHHISNATEAQFAYCPIFIQERIEKKFELRVVYVNEKLFAFRIDPYSKKYTSVDWRWGNHTLNFTEYNIDESLSLRLSRFMKVAQLTYGHFDLIVDNNDDFIFLECNADGQWMWLDPIVNGEISDEFANMLQNYKGTIK